MVHRKIIVPMRMPSDYVLTGAGRFSRARWLPWGTAVSIRHYPATQGRFYRGKGVLDFRRKNMSLYSQT